MRTLHSKRHLLASCYHASKLLPRSSVIQSVFANPHQPLQRWTHYLQVVNHLTTTTQLQPLLCLATHLPCAHWKGRSHNSRSAMSSSLWLRVSGSPNLMAPWQAKLLRMVRSEGGTICGGWPASVHYRYTEGKSTILVKQVTLQQCTQASGCLVS